MAAPSSFDLSKAPAAFLTPVTHKALRALWRSGRTLPCDVRLLTGRPSRLACIQRSIPARCCPATWCAFLALQNYRPAVGTRSHKTAGSPTRKPASVAPCSACVWRITACRIFTSVVGAQAVFDVKHIAHRPEHVIRMPTCCQTATSSSEDYKIKLPSSGAGDTADTSHNNWKCARSAPRFPSVSRRPLARPPCILAVQPGRSGEVLPAIVENCSAPLLSGC